MIELDDNIEALEVCIRNGTPSYSVRLSSKNMRDYLDKLLEVGLINQEQYTTAKCILNLPDVSYSFFNVVNTTEFRVYVGKPNLFGYVIDECGLVIKEKEYIENYYVNIRTGDKKYYSIKEDFYFDNVGISIPKGFCSIPVRSLYDENGQIYYEFLPVKDKEQVIKKISEYYDNIINSLTIETATEKSTWGLQFYEATKWLEDRFFTTPMLDSILLSKEYSKEVLVDKVIFNYTSYTTKVGKLLGEKQKLISSITNI